MKIRMRQQQCSFDKKSSKLVAADSRLAPQALLHLSRAKIRWRSKYKSGGLPGLDFWATLFPTGLLDFRDSVWHTHKYG